ncbi:hypothetical protein EC991_005613 [Linnemannia zychae]|nr:hypothetical protein EC991_005613 [Linnemannia zychae]
MKIWTLSEVEEWLPTSVNLLGHFPENTMFARIKATYTGVSYLSDGDMFSPETLPVPFNLVLERLYLLIPYQALKLAAVIVAVVVCVAHNAPVGVATPVTTASSTKSSTLYPSPIHRRPKPLLPPNITSSSSTSASYPTTSPPTTTRPGVVMYNNHKIVRFNIKTEEQLDALQKMEEFWELDYFTHHKRLGGYVDARISPAGFQLLSNEGPRKGLNYELLIDDVQRLLDQENEKNEDYQRKWQHNKVVVSKRSIRGQRLDLDDADDSEDVYSSVGEENWFAGYHLYRDHVEWLKAQIRNYPAISRPFSAGKTFEGRYQAGIKIGSGTNHVVLHGLQHSREWITGSVVEYLIHQLLVGADARVPEYLKKYTFHIIPIMNPDGFIITQTTDRLHRKNAQREGSCLGTDINRNWDYYWNESSNDASSTDPCASNYRGPNAFSSPEATNIARYLKSLPNVALYMDFHAYSQLLLTPYGYTSKRPATYDSYLKLLADGAVKALEAVYGTHFQAGDIYHTIYPASGSSIDYAMGEANVPVALGFELRDTGLFGFCLPAEQILPSGQETWVAFAYILDNLKI